MPNTLNSFIDDFAALVSPPEVWFRINEVVQNPHSSASDVADVTARDPALTVKLLKIVNSPFYNFPTRVDTVSRAVTILGTSELFTLVTAISAAKVFANIPNNLVRPTTFWRHSICTGIMTRKLARQCNVLHPERLYVAGLLHDIGSLLLYRKFSEKAAKAVLAANGDEQVLYHLESEIFGFNHAQIGAELMRQWNLPSTLVEAIKYHHDPAQMPGDSFDSALVHIADTAANRLEYGCFMEHSADATLLPDPAVWRMTGLPAQALEQAVEGLEEELNAAVAVFLPEDVGSR